MANIIVINESKFNGPPITTRCPCCGNNGVFEKVSGLEDLSIRNQGVLGQRKCPNLNCRAHIFFVINSNNELYTYPPLRIGFDATDIPDRIVETFNEAITCHAEGCFVASGIMIRRTLEELCEEEEGGKGGNLKGRIGSLQDKLVIPKDLFEAMDELRLLGNDAAHIESKDYDNIGSNEIEVGIELTREILKAVYQMKGLVNKLKSLKVSEGNSNSAIN